MKNPNPDHSFTLIELLIVVAIIGILIVIAVPNFLNAQVRAKVAAVESNFKTIATANEMYRFDHGTYFSFVNLSTVAFRGFTRGFIRLTTPIAYLSYDAVNDPFASKFKSGIESGSVEYDKTFDYTISLGSRAYRDNEIFQTKEGDYYTGKVNSYMLESVGPDTLDSVIGSGCFGTGCIFDIFILYNPSNGICSEGDIVKVVGTVIPEMRKYF